MELSSNRPKLIHEMLSSSAQTSEPGIRDYRKKEFALGMLTDSIYNQMPATATPDACHSYPCIVALGSSGPESRLGIQSSHHIEQGTPMPTCLQSGVPKQWSGGLASLPSGSHCLKYLLSQNLSSPLTDIVPKMFTLRVDKFGFIHDSSLVLHSHYLEKM